MFTLDGELTHPGVFSVDLGEMAVEVVRVDLQQLLKVDITRPVRFSN